MPVKLSEIRAQYPMYDNVPDHTLLSGLHKKHYSDMKFGDFLQNITFDTGPKATDGMTGGDLFLAGVGKSMVDTVRGVRQLLPEKLGGLSREDIKQARQEDSSLMQTSAGKAGDLVGNIVTMLPTAFIPGANTVKGASLIGAATGFLQPSESTAETIQNATLGTVGGGGSVMLGRGLAGGAQAVTGVLRPMTEKGQKQIAAEVLAASATDANKAASRLSKAKPLVKGSFPTVGQASDDAGLAQLERTLLNNPESAGPIQRAYEAQRAARVQAITETAGTPEYRKAIEEGRKVFANEDYSRAFAEGVDVEMAKALKPQIDSLMRRPSLKSAVNEAKMLASERDIKLTNMGSIEGLDWLKKALDNKISRASQPGSSIGKEELRGLMQTKQDLMAVMEQVAPAYKVANDNFAQMSRQINSANVAADLQNRLYKNAEWGSGKEFGTTYMNELSKAKDSVRSAIGYDAPLDKIMDPKDISVLEGIAKDLARKEAAQNLGKASGSNTMQNMLGQNLLQRVAGPLGVPSSFAENTVLNTLMRPYSWAMQYSQPRISSALADAMADPAVATQLLIAAQKPKVGSLTAKNVERYLAGPGAGLLSSSGRE